MDGPMAGALLSPSTWEALGAQTRATLLTLFGQALARLPAALFALVVVVVTAYAARLASRSASSLGRRVLRSPSLQILFAKSAAIGVWLLGVTVAALLLFPGLRLGDIVATLGLGSVAIGFAFQDIFKNFLAGVLLLINEPFRIGDAIVVDKYEGYVEHIDIRTTNVRTYDGELILIPNSLVFTSSVQVRTAFPLRRTDLAVGVAYDADVPAAAELARATVAGIDGVANDPPVVVDATAFGDSAVDLTVRYWTAADPQRVLRTKTKAVVAIKAAFDAAHIEIPFPSTSLYVRGGATNGEGRSNERPSNATVLPEGPGSSGTRPT